MVNCTPLQVVANGNPTAQGLGANEVALSNTNRNRLRFGAPPDPNAIYVVHFETADAGSQEAV
jgi:hypothetical protein